MKRPRRAIGILIAFGLTLLAVLAVLSVVAVTVPGVCEWCHKSERITPSAGNGMHSGVSCLQCHAFAGIADRAELSAAIPLMLLRSAPDGIGQVSSAACLKCHPQVSKGVTEAGGLRIDHRSCVSVGADCATCHDRMIHGLQGAGTAKWDRSMGMEECVSCHESRSGSQACETCHDGKMQRARLRSGVWELTHGPDWQKKHGLGGTRMCTSCHQPTDCAKCHGIELPHLPEFSVGHGADSIAHPASCKTCHKPRFCSDCHGITMPHPKSFMPTHKVLVKRQGDKQCYSCHAQRDCRVCHDRHVHPGWAKQAGGTGGGVK